MGGFFGFMCATMERNTQHQPACVAKNMLVDVQLYIDMMFLHINSYYNGMAVIGLSKNMPVDVHCYESCMH